MTDKPTSKLELIRPLIGRWAGDGQGFGTVSRVETEFEYFLQDQFVKSATRSESRDSDGNLVEIHEDWEIFSYDPDQDVLLLRGFYTEGYVNHYVLDEPLKSERQLTFTSEKTEGAGGLRARLRFEFIEDDTLKTALDLARPGEDFRECQVAKLNRMRQ